MHLDVDAHGRVTSRDDATRRALADRAGRFTLLPSATDLLLARRTPAAGGTAARPRCVLAGDLSGFPIVDFVAFIHQSRLTGVLTVATDGRFSRVRKLARLEAVSQSAPMEVLWLRLPRRPDDHPEEATLYFGLRQVVVVLERLRDQVDGPGEGEHDEDDC